MGSNATLSNSLFPTGDAFEDRHALLHELKSLDIQQISARKAMLGDKNWLLVALDVRQEFGGLTLESGDKFGTHEVTLQYHFRLRKRLPQRANARGNRREPAQRVSVRLTEMLAHARADLATQH